MNFFAAQEQARLRTRWLVLLFVSAVVGLIALTHLLINVSLWLSSLDGQGDVAFSWGAVYRQMSLEQSLVLAVCITSVIAIASLLKWSELRGGGRVVAEQLGGRLISQNTDSLFEKRLINVVQEMAIASGVPVPPVYVMDREHGINAFAAGWSHHDAVIAVTRGCIEHLNREQLQGVVAHEFSHIFNGDMRLNLKLIAILNGLLVISSTGRLCMHVAPSRSSSRRDGSATMIIVLFGISLMVIGWIGQLFGQLIQAAVSRQREYLADASAVKFTRNPEGVGGALIAIGGHAHDSQLSSARAHDVSHLFFASVGKALNAGLATHPPLNDRIKRILPRWDGAFPRPEVQQPNETAASKRDLPDIPFEFVGGAIAGAAMGSAAASATANETASAALSKPKVEEEPCVPLDRLAEDPLEASLLLLAMLLDSDDEVKDKQLATIEDEAQRKMILHLAQTSLSKACVREQLTAVEIASSTFKSYSKKQYAQFRKQMIEWARMDSHISLFEWALVNTVRSDCDAHFGLGRILEPKYRHITDVSEPLTHVLYLMAKSGQADENAAMLAFNRGCNTMGLYNASMPKDLDLSMPILINDAQRLARVFPLLKPRILKGFIACAVTNSEINDDEYCLLVALSMLLDIPLMNLETHL